jgi:hypothetical protein
MFTPSITNPVRKFRDKRIWVEEGMVIIVDDQTGEFTFDPWDIAEKKAEHAASQAGRMNRGEFGNYQDERREMLKLAQDLRECAELAKTMEPPIDRIESCKNIMTREAHDRRTKRMQKQPAKPLLFVPQGIE